MCDSIVSTAFTNPDREHAPATARSSDAPSSRCPATASVPNVRCSARLAYIAGERKAYRVAILHMKCCVELMPDGPDARAARDKIIIWEDKIQTDLAREIAESPAASGRRR